MRFGYMRYRRSNPSSLSLKHHDSNMKAAGLRAVLQSCFLLGLALYSGMCDLRVYDVPHRGWNCSPCSACASSIRCRVGEAAISMAGML